MIRRRQIAISIFLASIVCWASSDSATWARGGGRQEVTDLVAEIDLVVIFTMTSMAIVMLVIMGIETYTRRKQETIVMETRILSHLMVVLVD